MNTVNPNHISKANETNPIIWMIDKMKKHGVELRIEARSDR